jgi:hypothetical protein
VPTHAVEFLPAFEHLPLDDLIGCLRKSDIASYAGKIFAFAVGHKIKMLGRDNLTDTQHEFAALHTFCVKFYKTLVIFSFFISGTEHIFNLILFTEN